MSLITDMIEAYRADAITLDQLVAKLADYHYATPARMQGGPTDIFERGAWLDEQPYYTDGSWDEVLRARNYGLLSPEEYDAINRGFEMGRKDAKGGSGSGNFGHEGRPGEVGGSGGGGGQQRVSQADAGMGLSRYQRGGYSVINATLRGIAVESIGDPQVDEDAKNVANYIAGIDSIMEPLPASTLFRGLDPSAVGALLGMPSTGSESGSTYAKIEAMSMEGLGEALRDLEGTSFMDKGFVSTSRDENFAGIRGTYGRVEVELDVPVGIKGIDMNSKMGDTAFRSEKEVLLQRDLSFRITGVSIATRHDLGGDDPQNRYTGKEFQVYVVHARVENG